MTGSSASSKDPGSPVFTELPEPAMWPPEAVSLAEWTAAQVDREFSPSDEAIAARMDLALVYSARGQRARAVQEADRLHTRVVAALGVDHPMTHRVAHLASTLRERAPEIDG